MNDREEYFDRDEYVMSVSAAYAALLVAITFIICLGYLGYKLSNGLPGLQVLVGETRGSKTTSILGQDNPLEINYSLQENEPGEIRLSCTGNLLGFEEAVMMLNGDYIANYQLAINFASINDQDALNQSVDDMAAAVNSIDNLPIPSCVGFMEMLASSHKTFFDGLLAFLEVMNAEESQDGANALTTWRNNNDSAYLANGFFFGKLALIVEFVEGEE